MRNRGWFAAAAAGGVVLLGAAATREILDVQVINFPDPQRVRGAVSIEGTVRHAELVRIPDVIVPPVKPTDTTRLITAGTLVADGFTQAVLSVNGITKGDVLKAGSVGAILVPEEEIVVRTFLEAGQIQFPLEATASVGPGSPYFASTPERRIVAFPRYRVLLYNTTDKTVTANVFAYLTY
jgi:hypothetical protein